MSSLMEDTTAADAISTMFESLQSGLTTVATSIISTSLATSDETTTTIIPPLNAATTTSTFQETDTAIFSFFTFSSDSTTSEPLSSSSTFSTILFTSDPTPIPPPPNSSLSVIDSSSLDANTSSPPLPSSAMKLMSDWQKKMVDIYLIAAFGTVLCIVGIVANVMNLIVYCSQRNKDTVSLSLTYLSVSDIGVLVGSLFSCLCYVVVRIDPFSTVDAMGLQWGIGAQVRHMFINISLLTTVFVSVERCLCVVLPFKVKFLVGPKRTHAANILFYLFIFASYTPDYISKSLQWRFDPRANKTRLMMITKPNRATMEHIKDSINHILLPFAGQIIVMFTTFLMISALHASSRFRNKLVENGRTNIQTAAATNGAGSSSWRTMNTRDKRVVKMVTTISTIFIICNTPMVVGMSCRRAFPEFHVRGTYTNIHTTVFAIVYLASSFSATVNTLVYYFGSTRFKKSFDRIFCQKPEEEGIGGIRGMQGDGKLEEGSGSEGKISSRIMSRNIGIGKEKETGEYYSSNGSMDTVESVTTMSTLAGSKQRFA